MYATPEQLLIKAILGESFEEKLQKVIGFYHDDFNEGILRVQLRTLLAVIDEVVKMIKLVIVMPVTNSVSECSFSAMRRLYTYLRTSMGSSRLNNSIVLHIHKDRLDKLSMVDVANDFVFESDHRKTLFGRFDDVDLRRKSIPVKSVVIQLNIYNLIFVRNKKYTLSSLLSICCPEFTANFYLRLI